MITPPKSPKRPVLAKSERERFRWRAEMGVLMLEMFADLSAARDCYVESPTEAWVWVENAIGVMAELAWPMGVKVKGEWHMKNHVRLALEPEEMALRLDSEIPKRERKKA
jgi:hypothetical protein